MSTSPTNGDYTSIILEHYRKEAEIHGADASSTMRDEITRGREIAAVLRLVEHLRAGGSATGKLLDVGCGNGYLLGVLRGKYPTLDITGLEYTPEMVAVARERAVPACPIVQGDVRSLPFPDASFDVVVTERCIINVMDREQQATSLREVGRVLRPGGHFICIEAFADGLEQLNAAREELGLPPNVQPHHNIWFDKKWFLETIEPQFGVVDLAATRDPSLPPPNFLSSHYFISRVLYPSVTKREILYNTHFVKFFASLPPTGNYSPIQVYLLKRR
jgi:ubiquinone/menaquinone biosynthesis C-methylase UbiE